MPYPNEHACRLLSPDQFQEDSFRRGLADSNGKVYSVIWAEKPGEAKMIRQAYRYDRDTWSTSEASAHCKAHLGSFEAAKDENFAFFRKDQKKQIVYGVALEPDTVDAQEEFVSAEDIEEAAHDYLVDYRKTKLSHKEDLNAVIVESYIAPVDFMVDGTQIKKGSWVAAMKILDSDAWKAVENGDLVGFSIGGVKQFT